MNQLQNMYSRHHQLVAIVTTTCDVNLKKSLEEMDELSEKNYPMDMPDHCGRTGLYFAARSSKMEIAERLLSYGASPNVADDEGMTPLHIACCNGSLDMIKLLVDNGGFLFSIDKRGDTPFHWAVREERDAEIVAYLKTTMDNLQQK